MCEKCTSVKKCNSCTDNIGAPGICHSCTPKKRCGSCERKEICKPQKPTTCFEKPEPCCDSTPPQIDARRIIYKKDATECSSILNSIGITHGTDLEFIIDKFGQMLEDFNYFDVKGNIFGAENFEEFLNLLQKDLKNQKSVIKTLQETLVEQNEIIESLKERLDSLEKPALVDSAGLDFTVDSTLKEVLQKIIDNE